MGDEEAPAEGAEMNPKPGETKKKQTFAEGVAEAKRNNKGGSFVKSYFLVLCATTAITICLLLLMSIPITMIGMGGAYIDKCPRERMIPIFLIVFGVFAVVAILLSIPLHCQASHYHSDEKHILLICLCCVVCVFEIFLFIWFLAGNVWVFRINMPTQAECDTDLYLFSFWIIIVIYILVILLIVILCCITLIIIAKANKQAADDQQARQNDAKEDA